LGLSEVIVPTFETGLKAAVWKLLSPWILVSQGGLPSCSSISGSTGEKKPFLIGVAGGTASGKVRQSIWQSSLQILLKSHSCSQSSVCEKIMDEVKGLTNDRQVAITYLSSGWLSLWTCLPFYLSKILSISQDSFYKELEQEEDLELARKGLFNFDHPGKSPYT